MIGCGDLRFSASVLCIASCNVGFSRRSRCLIKSACLSILLFYFSVHMNLFMQALIPQFRILGFLSTTESGLEGCMSCNGLGLVSLQLDLQLMREDLDADPLSQTLDNCRSDTRYIQKHCKFQVYID
jgi:hypothetical protein